MAAVSRITTQHEGRPMDWTAFDGKQYHGRIVRVIRRHWLHFTYYVPGFGDVTTTMDLRVHRDRIVAIW